MAKTAVTAVSAVSLSICLLCFFLPAHASDSESTFSANTCERQDAKVLILGAGMAGIAAAYSLQQNGTSDFIILEAQDRVGGRMRTDSFAGLHVNAGAAWMQGLDPKHPERWPLWWLKTKCEIQGFFDDINSIVVYNEQGKNISGSPSLRWDVWNLAFNRSVNISLKLQKLGKPDISARDALSLSGWIPHTAEDAFIEWFRFDFCTAQSPDITSLIGTWPDPTYQAFGSPNSSASGYYVNDSRGYAGIAECLAEITFIEGDSRLHLNATVTKIQWSGVQRGKEDKCVCATAMEGGVEKMYCAPYAIVTFSLGVLQSERFQQSVVPPLPAWKLDAIVGVSFATYLKVFVEFESRFWGSVSTRYIGRADQQRGYYVLIENFASVFASRPNVLTFTLVAEQAHEIYKQSLNDTTAEIMIILRNIFGDNVTDPIQVFYPDWYINPLFLGTYSNSPVGVTDEVYTNLAAPLGTLYFAGEATDPDFSGYVHGAYFQGLRVANDILKAMNSESETLVTQGTPRISMATCCQACSAYLYVLILVMSYTLV